MQNEQIYIIQWTNNFGGLENVTKNLEKALGNSYNVKVIILNYNKKGLRYINYIYPNFRHFYVYLWLFAKILKNSNAIWHLNNATLKVLIITYLAGARNIVYHFHGTKFKKGKLDKRIWSFFADKVNIIVNSTYVKTLIQSTLNLNNNVFVVPNLLNIDKFTYTKRIIGKKVLITYAGRITKGKNIDVFIEVAKYLTSHSDKYLFHIYGNGPEKENIAHLIESNNLDEYIKIFDFVDDIQEVYKKTNVFLFLSSHESFGNVVAESILSGTPPLCFEIPALKDIVIDDTFLINTLEVEQIAKMLDNIILNYDDVLIKVEKNKEYLKKYLNNEKLINTIRSLYKAKG